jgi:hypothetical protein
LSASQTYTFLGSKVYGGSSGDASSQILKIREDRLLLIGESNSSVGGNKVTTNCNPGSSTNDIWVVMVDTAFNIIWQSEFGGSFNERKASAIEVGNGNLLLSFMSNSDSSCNKSGQLKGSEDIMVIMIDSLGSLIWEKNFGTSLDCYGSNLSKLSDGNFLLATSTRAGVGFDKTSNSKGGYDLWFIKLIRLEV